MAKGWSMSVKQRAAQQRVESGQQTSSWMAVSGEPSKAELRASIPAYDPSMVKRVETKPTKRKPKK